MPNITLKTAEDRILIANLFHYYVYDMSEYMDWAPGDSGLYLDDPEQIQIHDYWQKPDHFPFIIEVDNQLAGFALVQREEGGAMDVGQFFVLRRFKGKGIGLTAFKLVTEKFPGPWQVRVLTDNRAAMAFWSKAIAQVSQSEVHTFEETDEGDHLKYFQFRV